MKSVLKKILICLIIVVLAFNFALEPSAHAVSTAQTAVQSIIDFLATVGDGLIGILTYLPKIQALIAEIALMGVMGLVATTFGYVDTKGNVVDPKDVSEMGLFTPDDIFFNKIALTDINIFNLNDDLPDTILSIRTNIALWYYIMRTIAVAVLLAILLYIAIRMAISTVASDKAEYKKMLVNWASSIALVFVLHYVIVLVCNLNSIFVNIFAGIYESLGESNEGLDLGIGNLLTSALSVSATTGWASIVVVGMIIVQTFAFLIYYVKRMLTVSFLVIISPLITITYSIDKLGDGKAQALNTWLKEFFFTVIIQPFHCVIYMVFISLALSALGGAASSVDRSAGDIIWPFTGGIDSLVGGLLAILCIKFVWDAEKIVKNIFGIKVSEGLGDAVASAAIAGAIVSKGMSTATKATGAVAKKVTKVGGNGTLGGVLKDFGNKVGSVGNKVGGIKIGDKELRDTKLGKGAKFVGKVTTAPIRGLAGLTQKGYNGVKSGYNSLMNTKAIKGFKNYLNENPNGMRLKRYLTQQSPAIAAAMLGGAMMYGSSDKRSLFDAGVAGYGAYKAVDKGIETLRRRKEENYEDNVKDNGAMAYDAVDKHFDKDDPEDGERAAVTAQRMGEEGELSDKKIQEKYDKSEEELTEILKNEGVSDDQLEKMVEKIMEGALNGIFNKDLNYENLAKGTPLSADQIKSALSGLVYTKSMRNIYEENKNINSLGGQDDFYKAVWAGHVGEQEKYTDYKGENPPDWENVGDQEEGDALGRILNDYQNQVDSSSKKTDLMLEQLLAALQTAGHDTSDINNLGAELQNILNDASLGNSVAPETINFANISGATATLDSSEVSKMINNVYANNKNMSSTQLKEEVTRRIIEEHVEKDDISHVRTEEKDTIIQFVGKVADNQAYTAAKSKIDNLRNS